MAERKHKRETEEIETDEEETSFILEPTQLEIGSGYTLSVNYDENEKPIINIKTYGQVDVMKLRREIEKLFPNAQINQLNQAHSITVVKRRKGKSKRKK
jgi:hypothetical protein